MHLVIRKHQHVDRPYDYLSVCLALYWVLVERRDFLQFYCRIFFIIIINLLESKQAKPRI